MPRMPRRPVRSVTVSEPQYVPRWARFAVVVCHAFYAVPTPPVETPSQAFSCRADAERWGAAIAKLLPGGRADGGTGAPLWWVLVVALDNGRSSYGSGRVRRNWHCYRAHDPGGGCVKNHPILAGYGVAEGHA